MPLTLHVLSEPLAVCRLPADAAVDPAWLAGPLAAVVRTRDELSLVLDPAAAPAGSRVEAGWRGLRVAGPLDFSLVGVLAGLSTTLAEAAIGLFAISTFDTDYLLVREHDLAAACDALRAAGHRIDRDERAVRSS